MHRFWFSSFLKKGLIAFAFFVVEAYFFSIGENVPDQLYFNSIESNTEKIFGQTFSADTERLKIEAAKKIKAEVIVIGNSRMNNFRAKMFQPYRFYNIGRTTTNFDKMRNIISTISESNHLKVAIVIVEPFRFRKTNMVYKSERLNSMKVDPEKRLNLIIKHLLLQNIFQSTRDTSKFIGLKGIEKGRGYRTTDGSSFGGQQYSFNIAKQERRLKVLEERNHEFSNKEMFQYFNCDVSETAIESFRSLVKFAQSKGVIVVGVTPPFSEFAQNMLKSDPVKYQLWHTIQDSDFEKKMRSITPFYHNMSNFDSFGGKNSEMLDLIHPGEKLIGKIVLKIMSDKNLKSILPDINISFLKERINSTQLPVFDVFSN